MKKWTDDRIKSEIISVMNILGIKTMPTAKLIHDVTGDNALSVAISKHNGYRYWANKLGIKMTSCETRLSEQFENFCAETLEKQDFDCRLTSVKYPYDILADYVKIDVKVSNLCKSSPRFDCYSFNLEKEKPTCDFYVAYCIDENKNIVKTYVIPSVILQGKKQLGIGKIRSKYDKYLNAWNLITEYNNFYKNYI